MNRCLLILLLLVFIIKDIDAQYFVGLRADQIIEFCEKRYNKNEIIENGKIYFSPYRHYLGTPFCQDKAFQNCTLFKLGKQYSDQTILLDIYNQQIILEVVNMLGGKEQLILSDGSIDSLYVDDSIYIFNDSLHVFLRVIARKSGHQLLLLQNKKLRISQFESKHEFFQGLNKLYYANETDICRIKSKRDLMNRLPEGKKQEFKTFMRTNRFSLKKINDLTFRKLISKFALLQ